MLLRCSVLFVVFIANVLHIHSANIPVAVVYNQKSQPIDSQKNLDAKVQLTSDEILKSEQVISKNAENQDLKTEAQVENLRGTLSAEQVDAENHIEQQNYFSYFLKKAEEITYTGIESIKDNIDKASETLNNAKPNAETWQKLNQTLEQFFNDQHKSLKQDKPPENNNNQGNQFQNFITNLQNTWNNFMNNNIQQNVTQGGSEDQQTGQQNQNPWDGVSNFFQNGFSQVINNINNVNRQNSTGQEDTGSGGSSGGGGVFGNFVNQVQNFFQQNQGNNPTQIANNQSDTGVQPPQNSGGFFQQVINNFRPTPTTKAPSQGDEGVSSTTQSNNIFGNFGQAFQNVNFFGQQTTKAPQQSSSPSNPIASGAQAIGSQFGQVIGGQDGSGGSNPIVSGIQSFGNQTGGGPFGGSGGSNPIISGIQSFGNQTGGGPFGGSGGSNPIISGIQSFGNQTGGGPFGAGGQGGNPIESAAQAINGQISSQSGNNPLQNVQNVISNQSGDSSQKNDGIEKSR